MCIGSSSNLLSISKPTVPGRRDLKILFLEAKATAYVVYEINPV